MKNDYLWDGSGEVDPEVEELERTLRGLRHRNRPLDLPKARSTDWQLIAVAAVVLIALTVGLFLYLSHSRVVPGSALQSGTPSVDAAVTANQESDQGRQEPSDTRENALSNRKERDKTRRQNYRVALKSPPVVTFPQPALDLRFGRHIESSQLLLRAFRNLPARRRAIDVSYARQRSRFLLQQNILLRRNAETEGNLPAEDILGGLEPLLLDIANLPDRPRASDVAAIKQRIERKEMIAALQVYSTAGGTN
jgi:hypothetical protein